MLELNRASSGNAPPPIVPPMQMSSSAADQQANPSGFSTFTDALANVQALATQSQNGTPTSSTSTQRLQIGIPIAAPIPTAALANPIASESLQPQSLTSLVKKDVDGLSAQTPIADESDKTSPTLTVRGTAEEKPKQRKESGTAMSSADSLAGAGTIAQNLPGEVSPSAADFTAASPNQAAARGEDATPASAGGTAGVKTGNANRDLAFALNIQPNVSAGSGVTQALAKPPAAASQPDQAEAAAPGGSAAQLATAPPLTTSKTNGNDDTKSGSTDLSSLAATGNQSSSSVVMNAKQKTASAAVAPAVEVPPLQSSSGQALRTVQVQITGANNQTVDLRLMEKSGALTMSVRATDGTLTRALQQHLPDLTSKLGDQQLRTEWWRPDVQKVDSSQKQSNSSDSNDSAASQDKGNQGKGNSGQQGGRNTDEPDWLEELTNLRKSNQNGTQYSWHL